MREIPLSAIEAARQTIYEAAVRTPLVRLDLPFATDSTIPEIYLKLESLQPIGSFKIRGAWNAVRALSPEQLQRGVWTVSAGNAAQGVAFAARRAGAPCSVMVMDTAPQTKIDSIERLGARIVRVTYDEAWKPSNSTSPIVCRVRSCILSTTICSSPAMARRDSRSSRTCRTSMP